MISFPSCKINLGLNILSKRQDGFHNIETCFYPIPLADILEVIPANSFSFTSTGIELPGKAEDNLCVKAYRLLKQNHAIGEVEIHLHKIIPTGAGLGGGSSDAAATLLLLNSIFSLGLSHDQLKTYCSQLGSDCAFFLENKPSIGKGRGDELLNSIVDLKGKYIVLIKPPVHVSTADAYAGVKPKPNPISLEQIVNKDISHWRDALINDFEESVFKKHLDLSLIKEQLYQSGAEYASMSGSGSTLFGIFPREVKLRNHFPDALYWSGYINS